MQIARSCDPFLSSMDYIFALQDSYGHVLSLIFKEGSKGGEHHINSISGIGRVKGSELIYSSALKHLEDKLHGTVRTLGYESLTNSFIEKACKTSDDSASGGDSLLGSTDCVSSSSSELTFKSALRCHVLHGEDKFSKSSMKTRKVVRLLAQHCSPANLALIEMLWRDVIAESVLTLCSPLHPPSSIYYNNTPSPSPHMEEYCIGARSAGAGVAYGINAVPGSPLSSAVSAAIASQQMRPTHPDTPEMFASTLVDNLLAHLSKAREASRVDLRCVGCSMSADLAFAVAYRRLPGECGVELAKALAVKLSTLLDHSKSSPIGGNMNSSYPPLHQIADLIRVLFTQTSVEFQHFYEMLLARRLLKCKYSSLGNEREMIKLLPALDKSLLMIR